MIADIRDAEALAVAVQRCAAVFHLAAQVAVTTSMRDPRADFDVNLLGTINLLEALRRHAEPPPAIFASTNKVYGDLDGLALADSGATYLPTNAEQRENGISEDCRLSFHTPYGCSKGAADQYVIDYGRSFGLPTTVLRMSCIYGRRQRGTEDQGWVAHFLLRMLENTPITVYGDGKQVRDVLWIDDAVDAYLAAWRRIDAVRGQAFNLGGGPQNAVSLLQVLDRMQAMLGRRADIRFEGWRVADQRYFVADTRRLRAVLGWRPRQSWQAGLALLAEWFDDERVAAARVEAAQ